MTNVDQIADLQLCIRRDGDLHRVELSFTAAGSNAAARLIPGEPPALLLDEAALELLREAELEMGRYGEALTALLCADPRVAQALARAVAAAQGAGAALRLRIELDERDSFLHALRWEALRDPTAPARPLLGASERIRFSRLLSSGDLEPVRPRERNDLRALVVVANPAGLASFQLAPVDVYGEVERAQEALGELSVTVVAQSEGRPATLAAIAAALRDEPAILYLVAHGTLLGDTPYLWLENDQGKVARVTGQAFVEQLRSLTRRPALVVLGSCESAGGGVASGALAALGPLLAAAGIPAVLAMQGQVAQEDVARFMPVFFRELLRDGRADRAVAAGRATLLDSEGWWRPVLWMRVADGRLWLEGAAPPAAAPESPPQPNTLPVFPSSLVGREAEIAAIVAMLKRDDVRLLTLVGPGGSGKTRLAVAVAWQLLEAFPDGLFMVDLTAVRDVALVPSALAQALGVLDDGSKPLAELIAAHLRQRRALLVVDNCEQVIGAAPLLGRLLAAAPELEVIATSREPLRITGEHEYQVSPLPLPDLAALPRSAARRLEALAANPAVALFVDRARAVRPGFSLDAASAEAVAAICAQLDGLPLAIELAAARAKHLAPQALLARLGQRLGLLTGGARDRAAHQQTIRDTITWSHDLLEPAEQLLFARLALFAGGASLEAVENVCNFDGALALDPLDGVVELGDKSLLRLREGEGGVPRASMLGTIREYALVRLAELGELDKLRGVFVRHWLVFAEEHDEATAGPGGDKALERLEQEHDNLRAAIEHALAASLHGEAVRLGSALSWFWYCRGHLSEGRRQLDLLLPLCADLPLDLQPKLVSSAALLAWAQGDFPRAEELYGRELVIRRGLNNQERLLGTLNNLGTVAFSMGNYEEARGYNEESIAIARSLGRDDFLASLLTNLGNLATAQGDYARATDAFKEGLALARRLRDVHGETRLLANLGFVALYAGSAGEARRLLAESLALAQARENREGVAVARWNLGRVALEEGLGDEAAGHFTESLRLQRELGNRASLAYCLEGLAAVAGLAREQIRAARLWGAAEALREALGAPLLPLERSDLTARVGRARKEAGEEPFAAAWSAGRALPLDAALDEALGDEA
jgi:predicted ATPase/Tfp pilus assembly protein PilF